MRSGCLVEGYFRACWSGLSVLCRLQIFVQQRPPKPLITRMTSEPVLKITDKYFPHIKAIFLNVSWNIINYFNSCCIFTI